MTTDRDPWFGGQTEDFMMNTEHIDPVGQSRGIKPRPATVDIRDLRVPKSDQHIFGIHDEQGRSLVEFRIVNGQLEAKYYPSDLMDGAKFFVEFVKMLGTGTED